MCILYFPIISILKELFHFENSKRYAKFHAIHFTAKKHFNSSNTINIFFCLLAPGSYEVEKAEKSIHQSKGAITFGVKYKEQKVEDIPGKIDFLALILRFLNCHIQKGKYFSTTMVANQCWLCWGRHSLNFQWNPNIS